MVFSGVSGGSATRWKHVYGKAIQQHVFKQTAAKIQKKSRPQRFVNNFIKTLTLHPLIVTLCNLST